LTKIAVFRVDPESRNPVKSEPTVRSQQLFGFGVFSHHTAYIPRSIKIHNGRVPSLCWFEKE